MTPEERGRDIHRRTTMPDGGGGVGEDFVLDHIRAALAAEREACAGIAESMAWDQRNDFPGPRAIAAAIRARNA